MSEILTTHDAKVRGFLHVASLLYLTSSQASLMGELGRRLQEMAAQGMAPPVDPLGSNINPTEMIKAIGRVLSSFPHRSALPPLLEDSLKENSLSIFRRVAAKEPGHVHGDFLTSFAEAIIRADPENFPVLWLPAVRLIDKYKLWQE